MNHYNLEDDMMRRIALLLCSLLLLPSLALAQATNPIKLKVGMVAAVDMLALPLKLPKKTRSMPRRMAPMAGTPAWTMSVSPACSALSASTPVA